MNRKSLCLPLSLVVAYTFAALPISATELGKLQADQTELLRKKEKDNGPSAMEREVISTPTQKLDAALEAVQIHDQDAIKPDIVTRAEVQRPTVALALGGGGARGAAQIGVLRVLLKHNVPIDYVVGNSMGSIVGGLFSAGVPLDDIQEMLADKSLRRAYFPGGLPPRLLIYPLSKLSRPFGTKKYAGLWTGDKFEKYLNNRLPRPNMQISDTKIPFSAVAANLIDGKAYRISEGPLAQAIKASSAISPFIRPVQIGDKVYVDGGIRANLPASSAKETGADVVIAVLVDEPLKSLPPKTFKHLAGVATRMADIVLTVGDERQLEFADITVNPDISDVPVLSNRSSDVLKAVKAGEEATERAMPQILKKLKEAKHNGTVAQKSPAIH